MIDRVPHYILDAWPVLEWAKGKQPVTSNFIAILESLEQGRIQLSMSRINRGEVIYLVRKHFPEKEASEFLDTFNNLAIQWLSVPNALIDVAVELKSRFAISYADAFAAAQAIGLSLPLLTGDRDLLELQDAGLLQLHWIGA